MSQETKHIADTFTLEQYRRDYAAAIAKNRPLAAKAIIRLGKIAGYTESEVRNEQEPNNNHD